MAIPSLSLTGAQQGVLEQKKWAEGPVSETLHHRECQRTWKGRGFIEV